MGNLRDWRESFSQLELARVLEREQDSRAAEEAVAGMMSIAGPVSEMELILPASEVPPKPKSPAKQKSAAKRTTRRRKPAAKKAVRKPAARKVKTKASAPKRRPAAAKVAEAPAIPLPDLPAPYAEPASLPEPLAPLPRQASLTQYRKGGLIEAIGFWLRTATRRAKAKLGASKVLAKSVEPAGEACELAELKAENERLRRQLDALLALSDAAQFKFQS